eukprot:jgi/Chrpa1/7900/Chrysochromulina_OHIO_Genome00018915-RA
MSTPSLLDLVSATPEILGSATRPASAMGQIDPAPPAELTDAVSASPLEPFANPGAARQEPGEEPTMTQNVERPTMAADGFRLDPAADCADCESGVPVEKFVKIYLCEDKPPALGVTHAHFDTVGTLYAKFDIAAYVAKSGHKPLEDFFAVHGDTCETNFCFNLDGPKIPNKAADLLYNLAKHSKLTYGMKKRVTHHVYVFSENWSAKPEDTWSDYIKDRFREPFRVPEPPGAGLSGAGGGVEGVGAARAEGRRAAAARAPERSGVPRAHAESGVGIRDYWYTH